MLSRVRLKSAYLNNIVILCCFASLLGDQYHKLPTFDELSNDQARLLRTLYNGGDPYSGEQHWSSLSMDEKATFFQITFLLEKAKLRSGENLISHVTRLENGNGILEGNKNDHLHFNGTRAEVDGWRIHVFTSVRLTANLLVSEGFNRSGSVYTHSVFGYEKSFRDYRVSTPPHLQLVLDKDEKGSDADIDKGKAWWNHKSAPRDVYERLAERYPDIQDFYVVDTKH